VEREGTGWRARIEGVRIAGKTGTSQKINGFGGYSARGRIASFVGIVPADQPRLVILIAIDEPKTAVYGGEVAAPVFQVIARHALAQLGIEGNKARRDWATMSLSPPDGKRTPGQPTPIRQTVELTSQEAVGSVPLTAEPNFLGLSLRSVLRKAQHEGQRVVTTGSGYVARQTLQNDPVTGEQIYALTLTPTGIGEARP
jgi:cell division protein FtsI (penicillin-binding protein 3)